MHVLRADVDGVTLSCPVCGGQDLEEEPDDREWLCPHCNHSWPDSVAHGEQSLICDFMAVRDEDGSYTLYELRYVDDSDTGMVIELRSGLSRRDAEKETSNILETPPEV